MTKVFIRIGAFILIANALRAQSTCSKLFFEDDMTVVFERTSPIGSLTVTVHWWTNQVLPGTPVAFEVTDTWPPKGGAPPPPSLSYSTSAPNLPALLNRLCPGNASSAQFRALATTGSVSSLGQASQDELVKDLNGDGNPDSVYLSSAGAVVNLLGASGSVLSTRTFAVGFTPAEDCCNIIGADFNGDGKFDLAISYSSSSGTGGVSVLLGNGDGTF